MPIAEGALCGSAGGTKRARTGKTPDLVVCSGSASPKDRDAGYASDDPAGAAPSVAAPEPAYGGYGVYCNPTAAAAAVAALRSRDPCIAAAAAIPSEPARRLVHRSMH